MAEGFYSNDSGTALTASFVLFNFAFHAQFVMITNDETSGSKAVEGSLDGLTLHFSLKPGETLELDPADLTHIYLRYNGGAPAYRLVALHSNN